MEREREKQAVRNKWGLILGCQDHDMSRRQTLNSLRHPGALVLVLKGRRMDSRPCFCAPATQCWQNPPTSTCRWGTIGRNSTAFNLSV